MQHDLQHLDCRSFSYAFVNTQQLSLLYTVEEDLHTYIHTCVCVCVRVSCVANIHYVIVEMCVNTLILNAKVSLQIFGMCFKIPWMDVAGVLGV